MDKNTNPLVDDFMRSPSKWQAEFVMLREILLDCGLEEDFKWCKPCYMFEGSNVAIIAEYKEYASLSFFKGALLKDEKGILHQPGNVQAGRLVKLTSVEQIRELEPTLRAFVREAIEVEKAGLDVEPKKTCEYNVPEELEQKFAEDPAFKAAFEALTPGRQRGYLLHFSEPKQSKTRTARIEKYMPMIFSGKGIYD